MNRCQTIAPEEIHGILFYGLLFELVHKLGRS